LFGGFLPSLAATRCRIAGMSKTEDREQIRRRALARAEAATHERLRAIRAELNDLVKAIDAVTLSPRRPTLRAGTMFAGDNLLPFRRGMK
jgi:hypothetical protein